MKRQDRRSSCPVSFALEIFGDTWTLLIIRDLIFYGKRTFGEFLRSEERIATNILAARLRHLEEQELIRKSGASQYSLTSKGLDLLPVLLEMIVWGAANDPATAAPPEFVARVRRDRAAVIEEFRARLTEEHSI